MEIYAICNWKISPFNTELNNGSANPKDYAFLVIPKEGPGTKFLNTTDINSYIVCSCPAKDIVIFPLGLIEVISVGGERSNMLFSRIIIDDEKLLEVVITRKEDERYLFVKKESATPGELSSSDGIDAWVLKTNTDLIDVNITVSRDPPSCK